MLQQLQARALAEAILAGVEDPRGRLAEERQEVFREVNVLQTKVAQLKAGCMPVHLRSRWPLGAARGAAAGNPSVEMRKSTDMITKIVQWSQDFKTTEYVDGQAPVIVLATNFDEFNL